MQSLRFALAEAGVVSKAAAAAFEKTADIESAKKGFVAREERRIEILGRRIRSALKTKNFKLYMSLKKQLPREERWKF